MPDEWKSPAYWGALLRNVVLLGGLLYAGLVFALSGTFADKSVEDRVDENSKVLGQLAEDVQAVKLDVQGVKALIMRDRLFELKIKQCDASSPEGRQFYAREIQELGSEYTRLTGQLPPDTPGCSDLR